MADELCKQQTKPHPPNTKERARGHNKTLNSMAKIPRGDTDKVGEDEVTVTSGLHAQAERAKRENDGHDTSVTITLKTFQF